MSLFVRLQFSFYRCSPFRHQFSLWTFCPVALISEPSPLQPVSYFPSKFKSFSDFQLFLCSSQNCFSIVSLNWSYFPTLYYRHQKAENRFFYHPAAQFDFLALDWKCQFINGERASPKKKKSEKEFLQRDGSCLVFSTYNVAFWRSESIT